MEVVSFTPWLHCPKGRSPWYPMDRKMGGTQSQLECSGKEIISLLLPEIEPQSSSPLPSDYTLTELFWLLLVQNYLYHVILEF